jgi:hypothetical protein
VTALTLQLVVQVAAPLPPRLLTHVTCRTPTLSLAVPLSATVVPVVEYVAAEVGPVIVTAGLVASGAVIVQVKDCDAVSTPSDTVAFTV